MYKDISVRAASVSTLSQPYQTGHFLPTGQSEGKLWCCRHPLALPPDGYFVSPDTLHSRQVSPFAFGSRHDCFVCVSLCRSGNPKINSLPVV